MEPKKGELSKKGNLSKPCHLFMDKLDKKEPLACHKKVIFIQASSRGLITLRGVLIIASCFYFTLRTMFNSSFFFFFGGGGGGGGGVNV